MVDLATSKGSVQWRVLNCLSGKNSPNPNPRLLGVLKPPENDIQVVFSFILLFFSTFLVFQHFNNKT